MYEFIEKHIVPRKRFVMVSSELTDKLNNCNPDIKEAVEKMERWFTEGEDINCYQSKRSYSGEKTDYQNCLYGTVHLHLPLGYKGNKPCIQANGFAARSGHLLYVLVRQDVAYFVDMGNHPGPLTSKTVSGIEWVSMDFAKIIQNNWPELINDTVFPNTHLCDATGTQSEMDDETLAFLTVNGISTGIPVGESGIYLSYGVNAQGNSTKAGLLAQREHNAAQWSQLIYEGQLYTLNIETIQYLKQKKKAIPDRFDFHYEYIPVFSKYVVREKNSGIVWDSSQMKIICIVK